MTDHLGADRLQRLLFYGVLILIAAGVYLVARPFLVPLGWAAILAICTWPLHARLLRWTKRPLLSASLSTIALTLVLIVPAVLLGIALGRQGVDAISQVQTAFTSGVPQPLADGYAWVQQRLPLPPLERIISQVQELLGSVAGALAKQAGAVVGAILVVLFDLGVMILALFFCFRDGPAMITALRRLLPFAEAHTSSLLTGTGDLIHASVTSGVIVAAVQGLIGGLIFFFLGLEAAAFWGVVMGFLSLFPLVGSWLVWAPAALWLLSTGHLAKGLILIVLGIVLVGGVDNLLRPVLIGGRARMSMLVLLIGLLGGVGAFGFIGLVLGPVILAIAQSVFEAYTRPSPRAAPDDRPSTSG
jgi:predicted PurR-regulated permease PerM